LSPLERHIYEEQSKQLLITLRDLGGMDGAEKLSSTDHHDVQAKKKLLVS
jgi:hypothetical protein